MVILIWEELGNNFYCCCVFMCLTIPLITIGAKLSMSTSLICYKNTTSDRSTNRCPYNITNMFYDPKTKKRRRLDDIITLYMVRSMLLFVFICLSEKKIVFRYVADNADNKRVEYNFQP